VSRSDCSIPTPDEFAGVAARADETLSHDALIGPYSAGFQFVDF